jgi:hypothetical protein
VGSLLMPKSPSKDDKQQLIMDCCRWGGKCGDHCCRHLALGGTGGNCGGKTIKTTEEEKANGTPPGIWLCPHKNNNQYVVGVRVGGIVIVMAWYQIPLCRRVWRGKKDWPPLQRHDANNNKHKKCNCDSVAALPSLLHPCPHQHCAAIFAGVIWCCCRYQTGIFAFLTLASLPLSC